MRSICFQRDLCFWLNSRLGLFSANPSSSSRGWIFTPKVYGTPSPEVSGVILPSSLTEGSLARLRILTPPTCVGLRYGHLLASLEALLDSLGSATSLLNFAPLQFSGSSRDGFAYLSPYHLGRASPSARLLPTLLCHPILQTVCKWYPDSQPILHHLRFSPRLRSRLTLGGRPFPRKP